jgi:hypothetical protein
MNIFVSGLDVVISLIFTLLVLKRYLERRKVYQAIWTIGLGIWTVAVLAELAAALRGRNPLTYKAYYATGALLVPAWLGLGSIYLLQPRRFANIAAIFLILASLLGIALIAAMPIRAEDLLRATNEIGRIDTKIVQLWPFFPVVLLLIVLNTLGTLAFIGGAAYPAWVFWRQGKMKERVIGNALIAVGALIVASGGSLARLGRPEFLHLSELLAIILIFIGFLTSSVRIEKPAPAQVSRQT